MRACVCVSPLRQDDDSEEIEDLTIRPTDMLFISVANEEDYNHLDICAGTYTPHTSLNAEPSNTYNTQRQTHPP